MENRRAQRVAKLLEREIPALLSLLPELPSRDLVTITGVEVTRDLRHARVYYSVLTNQEEDWHLVAKFLARHAKGLRHELAGRVVLKYHPEIRFLPDPTAAHAARIEALLKQIHPTDAGGTS
ncbi:MAG: 30S ribosome-binding factor RbfA [bacterium]